MFMPDQINMLQAKLDPAHVSERRQAGKTLSYIEGWHAIAEANRIFGFDGWDRELTDLRLTFEGEKMTKSSGLKPYVCYLATVKVTVRAGEDTVVRLGTGSGGGFGSDVGEAHESAAKEAETDAMKRALMTFGNLFGLALYDKTQKEVGIDEPIISAEEIADVRTLMHDTHSEEDKVVAHIKKKWGKDSLDKLSLGEAAVLIGLLNIKAAKMAETTNGTA